ncbi:MAG: DUF4065 domain-containing protein [Oscillospiraceae bacterium]|jgi:uncharacterized phage-associated protein|nr:DUF4065 domain-containing protein [Oscillospiraceae bacterium]
MANVIDAARYILSKTGETTSMKLQKLVYYAQAWSLAWDDKPLFNEDFQAWANGPVCPELFRKHKGHFSLADDFFDAYTVGSLTELQTDTIDVVLKDYAGMAPHELSDLTHRERPWIEARGNTSPGMPCETIIDKEVMRDYYAGLIPTA